MPVDLTELKFQNTNTEKAFIVTFTLKFHIQSKLSSFLKTKLTHRDRSLHYIYETYNGFLLK